MRAMHGPNAAHLAQLDLNELIRSVLNLTGEELQALAKDVIAQPREVIERMKWVMGN